MTQIYEETGAETSVDEEDRQQMLAIHYTMKYIVKDGQDLTPEMTDIARGVAAGITGVSSGVTKAAAATMMSLVSQAVNEPAFARAYAQIAADAIAQAKLYEQYEVEYQ
jgi:hypothetical protein